MSLSSMRELSTEELFFVSGRKNFSWQTIVGGAVGGAITGAGKGAYSGLVGGPGTIAGGAIGGALIGGVLGAAGAAWKYYH
ncbi:Blp family class II bacteriocin [Entomobacter blattae]|uniref:Bacteriocin n=1 Tax=Entomobacter blattae TaxID=2762277 RepID=A0A7H1NTR3_9PROT|nr:Blp family class II bacteriocin [Entomobacter blattae]QNT79173.1 hypothetical protein JGUZn3_19680 [Entomobacter blattae]QNT79460.1 hypothetical protein JGUZn3_22590 [Entomobacter blattae]